MYVGGWARVRACKLALKCAHVCRCALGLHHHRDNKVSRVICKLSGENFPAEARNLVPVAAHSALRHKIRASAVEKKTQTWRETITYSVGLHLSSQTGWVFICQSQLMHPVCSIQPVCFTQTKLDARTNMCKKEKAQ